MNRAPLSHTVVASWSLSQEVPGSSPFTVFIIILLMNSVKIFRENSNIAQEDSFIDEQRWNYIEFAHNRFNISSFISLNFAK